MSREIKFRAWSNKDKQMLDWLCIKQSAFNRGDDQLMYRIFTAPSFGDNGFTLMQYTGCKDCTGKEIYEGDMLGHPVNVVGFLNGVFCVNGDRPVAWLCGSQAVVGNIYEGVKTEKETSNT